MMTALLTILLLFQTAADKPLLPQDGHAQWQEFQRQLAAHRVWIQPGAAVQPITVKCRMIVGGM